VHIIVRTTVTAGALISDRWFYQVVVKTGGKLPGAGSVAPNRMGEDSKEIAMLYLYKENEKSN